MHFYVGGLLLKKFKFKLLNLHEKSNYEKFVLFFKVLIPFFILFLICTRFFKDYNILDPNWMYHTVIQYLHILIDKIEFINLYIFVLLLYVVYVACFTVIQLKNNKSIEIKYLTTFLYMYALLLLIYLVVIMHSQLLLLSFLIHIPIGIFLSYKDKKTFFLIMVTYLFFIFAVQYFSYQFHYKNIFIYLFILLGSICGFLLSKKCLNNRLKIKIEYINEVFFYGDNEDERIRNAYVNKVFFNEGLIIQSEFIKLKIIRLLRFLKRAFHNSTPIIISIFCSFLFLIVIIPIGLKYGKYTSIIDGIWDMKSFYLTSIIITGITSITGAEKNNHEKLLNQRYIYTEFLEIANNCSNFLYSDVLEIERLDTYYGMYNIPYGANGKFEKTFSLQTKLEEQKNNQNILEIDNDHFKNTITNYISKLNDFKPLFNENNIIGISKYDHKYLEESIYFLNKIKNINFKNENAMFILIKYYQELFWRLEYSVASLRRPWTSDLSLSTRIQKAIYKGTLENK